jgi:hypothetical protein
MLTHTVRNALGKLLLLVMGALLLIPSRARAADHVNLVVLVDLTKSVAVKGHDGKTECQKNFEAVTRLLEEKFAKHLPVLILGSIQPCSQRLGVNVEHVVAAKRV